MNFVVKNTRSKVCYNLCSDYTYAPGRRGADFVVGLVFRLGLGLRAKGCLVKVFTAKFAKDAQRTQS